MRTFRLWVVLSALSLFAAPAMASTHQVPFTYADIQAAINAAVSGDTITVAAGTYSGLGNRDLDFQGKGILLRSGSGSESTILDAGGSLADPHRVFSFHSGESASAIVEGFTIRNAYAFNGGAVEVRSGSAPLFVDCVFTVATARFYGGAVYVTGSSGPEFRGCTFQQNSAASGGAAFIDGASNPSFDHCTFAWNSATSGGALFLRNGSSVDVASCTFYGNTANFYGAGIFSDGTSTTSVTNTIISYSSRGEAVRCPAGAVTLSCSDVFGNMGGDWVGGIAGQGAIAGNFSADPQFCFTPGFSFWLHQGSPCIQSGSCGMIGAFNQGCPPRTSHLADPSRPGISAAGRQETASWGTTKAIFR